MSTTTVSRQPQQIVKAIVASPADQQLMAGTVQQITVQQPPQTASSQSTQQGGQTASLMQSNSVSVVLTAAGPVQPIITTPIQQTSVVQSASGIGTQPTTATIVQTVSQPSQVSTPIATLNTQNLRAQRIMAPGLQEIVLQRQSGQQSPTVVSVAGLTQGQLPGTQLRLSMATGQPVSNVVTKNMAIAAGKPSNIQFYRPQLRQQVKVLQAGQIGQATVVQMQPASGSGQQQIATLVKTAGSIPLSQVKAGQIKTAQVNPAQLRQMQIQQQLIAQKRGGKVAQIAQVASGKVGVPAQLIVQNPQKLPRTDTVQQIQQVFRHGPPGTLATAGQIVLGKNVGRVIPVSMASQGNARHTIQIRTTSTLQPRPQTVQIRTTTPIVRTPAAIAASGSGAVVKSAGASSSSVVRVGTTATVIGGAIVSSGLTQIKPATVETVKTEPMLTISQNLPHKPAFQKERERKASAFGLSSPMYGDDDINDVAAMGGVNLAEESQRILGQTEYVGTQIRSCKDEEFLHMPALQQRIRAIMARHGLEEPSNEVAVLISHATQERLKNTLEMLAVIAEHRIDFNKADTRYEVTKDVRGQIKFLEDLDKAEQKRHEEQEREMLMRAAKSRSKTEDPEQVKLKRKAEEMQRAELEELRQRDANMTALQAIGPRKKPRMDGDAVNTTLPGSTPGVNAANKPATPLRPRIKRVNLCDMLFFLEHEKDSLRTSMLYKAYLK